MGQKATSVEDQIKILRERGLEIEDEQKAKEILLDVGYYRLGFYWNPFVIDDEHNFKVGSKFSDVVELYYLDVDLRNVLVKYLNRIEVNFRTKVVYFASNEYKKNPTWFIDPKIMNQGFIDSFGKHYTEDFKKNNLALKKHHEKYINHKYAPAWKTLEFFTFGTILKIFKNLKDDKIKEEISHKYDIRNLKKFENFLQSIIYVRNFCAHSGVIFDLNIPKGLPIFPSIQYNDNNRNSLDAVLKVISFFLEKISMNRKKEMEEKISILFSEKKDNEILKKIISDKMGYKF